MRYVLVRVGPVLLLGGFLPLVFGQPASVEKAAKAVLEIKCITCHGNARLSDLDLRERTTILKGGKRGPAVVPGNAESSLLYKTIRREGDLQMPPGKSGLITYNSQGGTSAAMGRSCTSRSKRYADSFRSKQSVG